MAHRVGEIQERCDARDWYWVPTKENVADELTRDEENIDMNINSRWYKGPEFLYLPYEDWPKEKNKEIEENEKQCLEKKEEVVLLNDYEEISVLPNMYKFSYWMSLIKSTAIVLKFIRLCRKEECETKITRRNLEEAEYIWYKKIQEDSYRKEICLLKKCKVLDKSSRVYQLTPILVNNLVCVGGRTDNASDLLEETKKPIILNSKHFATKLLIQHYHNKTGHSGVELVQ